MMDKSFDNPIILFDGICNLCNTSVDFIISRDPRGIYYFASLQSEFGQDMIITCQTTLAGSDSLLLIEGESCYTKSSAALRIARRLQFPWPLIFGFIIVPRFLRDNIYDFIAENRYRWFGTRDTCRLPTAEERARFLG